MGQIHIAIVLPEGLSGTGGISRVMRLLDEESRSHNDVVLHFCISRGSASVALSPALVLSAILKLAWLKATRRCAVAHINVSNGASVYRKWLIAQAAKALAIPLVLHLHGSGFDKEWLESSSIRRRLTKHLFSRAARVVVLGKIWAEFVSGQLGCRAVDIVPNAAKAIARTRVGASPVRILFLGQLGERKGVSVLIRALGRCRDLPEWSATLAGDGDIQKYIRQAEEEGLGGRITVTGWVGPEEVDALLQESDILVLPSFAENQPLSVIEGMAAGLAVVATPVGAVEEIIVPGVTGSLVPAGDVAGLAEVLRRLCLEPSTRQALGAAAQSTHQARLTPRKLFDGLQNSWAAAAAEK